MIRDQERWASVPDAHDYLVSDEGAVRRLLPGGRWRTIRPGRNSKGYLKVCIGWQPCEPDCDRHRKRTNIGRGHSRQEYVQRLVWQAFKGIIPDDLHVDHIDDNQLNNSLVNLQLLTNEANNDKRWERAWESDRGAA